MLIILAIYSSSIFAKTIKHDKTHSVLLVICNNRAEKKFILKINTKLKLHEITN
jgi:hypothetical protein